MNKKKVICDYCTGCGLCSSVKEEKMVTDSLGYITPTLENADEFFEAVCPAMGKASYSFDETNMWGRNVQVYLGWSTDNYIRTQASSGGTITALCCYLIENKKVDGIIHTVASNLYNTRTVISRTKEEILRGMGSRYSISSPLLDIKNMVVPGEKYAFVGKPCDVSALRCYMEKDASLRESIEYLFSFFCAGLPSNNAQKKLLSALDCADEEQCESLQYRGNGWPGFATATKTDGSQHRMGYGESWGGILGRDVRKICHFCLDGIGEMADIACGDAWYLKENKQPDFSEHEGRNVIFARNDKGEKLLSEAGLAGYLQLDSYDNYQEELKYIQTYQYERKATMGAMILGMKLFGKTAPNYNKRALRQYAKNVGMKLRVKRFLGIAKRVLKGKI